MSGAARPIVLLVEDDPLILTALGEALTFRGFDVVKAETGEQGLAATRSQRIDAVILDVLLPDLNGLEILRELKGDAATRDLPVLVLTAAGTAKDREQALSDGAVAFLAKPPNLRELVGLLEESVHRPDEPAE